MRTIARLAALLLIPLLCDGALAQRAGARFDHTTTGYELTGAHRLQACESCHVDAVFQGTPRECVACHAPGSRIGATPKTSSHLMTANAATPATRAPCGRRPAWQMRWFNEHLPMKGVTIKNLSDDWMGFALSGPRSREIVAKILSGDVSNAAIPFLSFRQIEAGFADAVVARISLTGELGYEINVPVSQQRALYAALMEADKDLGLVNIGNRALDSLRLVKSYGIWNAEFTQGYTAEMSYLKNFIAYDKKSFIGKDAALKIKEKGEAQTLVTLKVDAVDAQPSPYSPVKQDDKVVGFVTSSAYGHYVKSSRRSRST